VLGADPRPEASEQLDEVFLSLLVQQVGPEGRDLSKRALGTWVQVLLEKWVARVHATLLTPNPPPRTGMQWVPALRTGTPSIAGAHTGVSTPIPSTWLFPKQGCLKIHREPEDGTQSLLQSQINPQQC